MRWTLLARDADRRIAGVLPAGSFKLTLRFNEVGSWSLKIPREATPAGWPAPGSGLIFLREGKVVASGHVDEEAFAWSADGESGSGSYELTGDTDLGRIAYRVVYPRPDRPWASQTEEAYFLSEDVASTVLRRIVTHQAGPDALPSRRVPGLRLRSGETPVGKSLRVKLRFTPLLDALRSVALDGGGLAFDVVDDLGGGLEFRTWQPVDRTNVAQFGVEIGNVVSLNVRRASPVATVALVAGQGEGVERDTVEVEDADATAKWGRREQFVDARGYDELAELIRSGNETLAESGEQTAVSVTILDTPMTQWGRDYGLGDRVSVLTPFGQVTDLVREVEITVDEGGVETTRSVIGTTDPMTDDPLAATVERLMKRISELERAL